MKKSTDKLDDSLIQLVDNAWKNYVSSKLSKVDGAVSDALKDWTIFEQSMTPEKMAQAILVDEKFKMNFSALVCGFLFSLPVDSSHTDMDDVSKNLTQQFKKQNLNCNKAMPAKMPPMNFWKHRKISWLPIWISRCVALVTTKMD